MKFKKIFKILKFRKRRKKYVFEATESKYYFPMYFERVREVERKKRKKFTPIEKIILLIEAILIVYFILAYLGLLPFF